MLSERMCVPVRAIPSRGRLLALLTLSAEPRPRYSFQTSLGDRLSAGFADAKCPCPYPHQRIFNCLEEPPVGLVQADLKLRFGIGAGAINEVAF